MVTLRISKNICAPFDTSVAYFKLIDNKILQELLRKKSS
jgi:hypothetical protein